MKNIILALLLVTAVDCFSQNADTSDYFSIGAYSGSYNSSFHDLFAANPHFSSVAFEIEYVKLRSLSVYGRFIHQFTVLAPDYNYYDLEIVEKPWTYRFVFSFGARYFFRDKDVKPFFQLGLNHEKNYVGPFTYRNYDLRGKPFLDRTRAYNESNYMINFGAGINFRIYKKLNVELQYDIYRVFNKEDSDFQGYSVLAGLKYNIFY